MPIFDNITSRMPGSLRTAGIFAWMVALVSITFGDPSPDWDPLADPDQDGRPNILELAVGSDEDAQDSDPYVVLDLDQLAGTGEVRFSFLRSKQNGSVSFPEFSTNADFKEVLPIELESVTSINDDTEMLNCLIRLGNGERGFARLQLDYEFPEEESDISEEDAKDEFYDTPIQIEGTLVDSSTGLPIAGATVMAHLDITDDDELVLVTTDSAGRYSIIGLPRRNALLRISAAGYRPEVVPVHLYQPTTVDTLTVSTLSLQPDNPNQVRFLFGGDTSFGRRFLNPSATSLPDDPDRSTVPGDHPDALIQASDPLPGAITCVSYVKPLFDTADYPVINLETPIVSDPSTPHPIKSFSFYTLPQTLGALTYLGVEHVTLGNNHTYDYLDAGVASTLQYVAAAGLQQAGLGNNSNEAFAPFIKELGGTSYAFLSACSVSGSQSPPIYLATADKGGAADLRNDDAVEAAIGAAVNGGHAVIAQLHTGKEYSQRPSDYAYGTMTLAVDAGADLMVGHHTHVAQGFEMYNGALMIHCLGNFVFDQQRLETLLALAVEVEMEGKDAVSSKAYPIYLEDFRPRMITGDLSNRFLRRIAEVSSLPVVAHEGRGLISLAGDDFEVQERDVHINVEIGSDETAIIDLRRWADSDEFLSSISCPGSSLTARRGKDLLLFGGMEETDIDESRTDGEASRWWRAAGASRSVKDPFDGAVALMSTGTQRLPEAYVYFSVSADGVGLGDDTTILNQDEIIRFDATADLFESAVQNPANGIIFGGDDFFQLLGNSTNQEDIDALYVHADGKISFSTSSDFFTDLLGPVRDGSVVTYDPSLPLSDPNSLTLLIDEEVLFLDIDDENNNQDIDAVHVDDEGWIYFSTSNDAVVNGIGSTPLNILDGDIVRFKPSTDSIEIYLREADLIQEDDDVDAFSFTPEGDPVFSLKETTLLAGSDEKLIDGDIGVYHSATQSASPLVTQGDLYGSEQGAQTDMNAVHLATHPNPTPKSVAQIAFRNRIRVEGDPDNTPNKDLTALGYVKMKNNGPMSLLANYYASAGDKGPELFGFETLVEHSGGNSHDWQFFAKDLNMPPDDPAVLDPTTDNARALRIFLYHEQPDTDTGHVGLDELAVVSWEVNEAGPVTHPLNEIQAFSHPHGQDFLRIEGPAGFYRLKLKFQRLKALP